MINVIKNVLKITIFFAIFFIIFVVLTYMKKPESSNLDNIIGFYAEEKNSLDMVYIGGSAAFVYFASLNAYEDYGIASYTFGTHTIQAEFYEYMAKEVMTRQKPKLLVIDARAYQYRDHDQMPTSVAYRNVLTTMPFNLNRIEFIENNVPTYLSQKTDSYHFDLFFYHTAVENRSIEDTINLIFRKKKNDIKGFHFVPKAMRMEKQKFKTDKSTSPSWPTVTILNSFLDYLKTLDCEVLFVVSPYIELESEKEVFNCIEKLIEKAGFDFLDSNEYYKKMKIDFDTDFYNYNHMNIYGAEKYTKFLSEYIKENYDLPDRREDKVYSSWDDLLENWHTKVQNTKDEIDKIINGKYYDDEIYVKEEA